MGGAAYAGYVKWPWTHVAKLPSDFDLRHGASLLQGLTALTSMKESYSIKKGDWILIHAIAGGLGLQYAQVSHNHSRSSPWYEVLISLKIDPRT